ncbi:YdcF family protein [Lichenibacterium dinghuense]|uniref:YdcF family protein n=1 Tax=Lichenibacterium dinghuense TaxID=2895977 RepID=UPI001F38AAA1|nr:YdcF family protein [Lichenibacterium sp. 6Y81]
MFFVLSKVLWVVTAPTNLLVGLALAGALASLAGRRWGARLAFGAVLALLLCGALPVGRLMLRPLEDRFPQPPLDGPPPAGIIVLGGAIDQVIGAARGQVTVPDAATRLTAGAALSRRFPGALLVYTGGSNALLSEVGDEAADAKRLWVDLGVDPDRVLLERASRNTEENAHLTRDLVHPKPGQRWILVTSAYHMPRSVGLFRAAGFDVVPDPVDYRSTGTARDLAPTSDLGAGLRRLDVAAREWIGLLAYRASGRIAEVFPAP